MKRILHFGPPVAALALAAGCQGPVWQGPYPDTTGHDTVAVADTIPDFPILSLPRQGAMVLIPARDSSFIFRRGLDLYAPPHAVSFTRDFWLDTAEVTQADFYRLVQQRPWLALNDSTAVGDDLPAVNVTFYDAIAYCNARSAREGLDAVYANDLFNGYCATYGKNGYRLPSEAEWEYACRAGTVTRYFWGNADSLAYKYDWSPLNSGGSLHPVVKKLPNPWGLHDMLGNAEEWITNCGIVYNHVAETDPLGDVDQYGRVIFDFCDHPVRGGSFRNGITAAYDPGYELPAWRGAKDLGFRCLRSNLP